jgi:hypothetical protein
VDRLNGQILYSNVMNRICTTSVFSRPLTKPGLTWFTRRAGQRIIEGAHRLPEPVKKKYTACLSKYITPRQALSVSFADKGF